MDSFRPSKRARNAGFVKDRSLSLPLEREPWMPPPYDKADLIAVKACMEGRAEPYQQRLALEWIVYACGTYETPWRPGQDGQRDSDFASGKQFIGQQIVKLINLPIANEEQGEQG